MIFITFEGIEGSGKSTQTKKLAESFKAIDKEVVLTREPGGTELAEKIRNFIMETDGFQPITELLLHNAARYEHVTNLIKPSLSAHKVVICDRYVDSTMAYQGYAMKVGKKLPALIHNFCMEGVTPNLTIILDLDPAIGLERSKSRGVQNRYESFDLEFHTRVRNAFLDIAKIAPSRCFVINAEMDIDSIHKEIIDLVNDLFTLSLSTNK
jgi:dTMP kinase